MRYNYIKSALWLDLPAAGREAHLMDGKPGDVLTINELPTCLEIPESTFYKLVREGKVPCRKIGRHWRFWKVAIDRWYVPDPNKAGDLEKLRERALSREFEQYRQSRQKRLKVFRLEAVRTGFKKAGRSGTTPPSSPRRARSPRTSSRRTPSC